MAAVAVKALVVKVRRMILPMIWGSRGQSSIRRLLLFVAYSLGPIIDGDL